MVDDASVVVAPRVGALACCFPAIEEGANAIHVVDVASARSTAEVAEEKLNFILLFRVSLPFALLCTRSLL